MTAACCRWSPCRPPSPRLPRLLGGPSLVADRLPQRRSTTSRLRHREHPHGRHPPRRMAPEEFVAVGLVVLLAAGTRWRAYRRTEHQAAYQPRRSPGSAPARSNLSSSTPRYLLFTNPFVANDPEHGRADALRRRPRPGNPRPHAGHARPHALRNGSRRRPTTSRSAAILQSGTSPTTPSGSCAAARWSCGYGCATRSAGRSSWPVSPPVTSRQACTLDTHSSWATPTRPPSPWAPSGRTSACPRAATSWW